VRCHALLCPARWLHHDNEYQRRRRRLRPPQPQLIWGRRRAIRRAVLGRRRGELQGCSRRRRTTGAGYCPFMDSRSWRLRQRRRRERAPLLERSAACCRGRWWRRRRKRIIRPAGFLKRFRRSWGRARSECVQRNGRRRSRAGRLAARGGCQRHHARHSSRHQPSVLADAWWLAAKRRRWRRRMQGRGFYSRRVVRAECKWWIRLGTGWNWVLEYSNRYQQRCRVPGQWRWRRWWLGWRRRRQLLRVKLATRLWRRRRRQLVGQSKRRSSVAWVSGCGGRRRHWRLRFGRGKWQCNSALLRGANSFPNGDRHALGNKDG
jgi:hypothetical protein